MRGMFPTAMLLPGTFRIGSKVRVKLAGSVRSVYLRKLPVEEHTSTNPLLQDGVSSGSYQRSRVANPESSLPISTDAACLR